MNRYTDLSNKMNNQLLDVHQYKLDIWVKYVLFDWHWWLGIFLVIIPLLIWLIYHQKEAVISLLLAGLSTGILSAFIDTAGHFLGWYDYQYDVLPIAPNYIPWDFVLIPITVMFTIQLFKNINVYLKGLILSALISFVGLPIIRAIGIYKLMDWHYFYSFIALFIIFVLAYQMSKIKNEHFE
ncbi:MAG TPA: CBO0543 family protein [Bacillales bacterium]